MELPAIVGGLPSWLLTQTAMHASRLVTESLGEVGARRFHYRVLASLEQDGPMSQAALGRRNRIHLSDMVATLNQLAEEGSIVRTPDPHDRRRNVVTVTARGRTRLRKLEKQVHQVQDDLLAPLTPDERTEFTRLLVLLLEHHHTGPDEAMSEQTH